MCDVGLQWLALACSGLCRIFVLMHHLVVPNFRTKACQIPCMLYQGHESLALIQWRQPTQPSSNPFNLYAYAVGSPFREPFPSLFLFFLHAVWLALLRLLCRQAPEIIYFPLLSRPVTEKEVGLFPWPRQSRLRSQTSPKLPLLRGPGYRVPASASLVSGRSRCAPWGLCLSARATSGCSEQPLRCSRPSRGVLLAGLHRASHHMLNPTDERAVQLSGC